MDEQIAESELILNPDGSVFHLGVLPGQLPDFLFLVGDPKRVPRVSDRFDTVEERIEKREFVTHIGKLRGQKVGVLSTGIGGDNIDIVLNELNLLANADFRKRTLHPKKNKLKLVRLGTSGSINPEIPVGSLLVSVAATGLDGLAWYYSENPEMLDKGFILKTGWPEMRNRPYQTAASSLLLERSGDLFQRGHTLTCSGFYRPQGRILHGEQDPALHWETLRKAGIDNLEMETAAIYFLSGLFGFEALSLNAILANRATGEFCQDPGAVIDQLIASALELFP